MKKFTAKAPEGVKSWDRIRFRANPDDYRCVPWPPLGPYWCSGEGDNYAIVVAYMPHPATAKTIKKYWPEASHIDWMQTETDIQFSDRFPKPSWWNENGGTNE